MIKRSVYLLAMASSMQSEMLESVVIEEHINTQLVQDISAEEIKSADLADALQKSVPSINIIRRSGIANDILLRGQKRDNINVIVDGTKIYGACVNRMDPPTSHVLTNNIESVEVTEGPFDVENFGTLSGLVTIHTKKPSKALHGDISTNLGSFGYQKLSGSISGGSDKVKVLFSASKEQGDQYKDGNGNTLAEQIENQTKNTKVYYQAQYKDKKAYEKSTFMGKVFVDMTDNQELRLSYTANRSDDVLYPSSSMDAIYDDSNIYDLQYFLKNLSPYSKKLSLQVYQSDVRHPMSTQYRNMGAMHYTTHDLSTKMQGVKLKNDFETKGLDVTVGIDTSKRNWDGHFLRDDKPMKMQNGMSAPKSLADIDTINKALFAKVKQDYHDSTIHYGVRYDDTSIESANPAQAQQDFSALSANVFATYPANDTLSYFAGVGKSSRVPDPRELFFFKMGQSIGTPTLAQTQNYEADVGFEKIYETFSIKSKVYYSFLKDYIAFNASKKQNAFENVDASIYGVEISGAYLPFENFYMDYGLSYKKGQKENPLTGQSGTNLADMRPLKANLSFHAEYLDTQAKLELIAASKWDDIDAENGEQVLDAYSVVNVKINHDVNNNFTLSLGIDNLFDKQYAITNTYKDLTLLSTGANTDDVMLLHEAGRYLYANVRYKF